MKTEHAKALDRAKYALMENPKTIFYTTILFSLVQKWDEAVRTAGVDGKRLWINPKFFLAEGVEGRLFILMHEVMHIALDHLTRVGDRDKELWNKAGDYVINWFLTRKGYQAPTTIQILLDPRFNNMTTEQVYDILKKEEDENPGTHKDPDFEGDIVYPGSFEESQEVEEEIASIILRANVISQTSESGNGAGDLPGELQIILDNLTDPKLPWNVIFQNHMSSFAKDDYSWQRPNRRFMPDHYMPSAYSEAVGPIAEAVDSSGSVSHDEFSYFINETVALQETLHPEKITILDFDERIKSVQEITEDTDILEELEFHGGGGTKIHPVLEWAKENDPEVLIIFTDGDFWQWPQPEDFPDCPIVWLIHNNPSFEISYGEVIHYEI